MSSPSKAVSVDLPEEFRVTELAEASGTSVRNIRVYQDRGLLPPPRRQGRIGLYSRSHLERLKIISNMLSRGYNFATIKELLEATASGRDLQEVLGIDEQLAQPWSEETPERVSVDDLNERFGGNDEPVIRQRAIQLGLIEATENPDEFVIISPQVIQAGSDLVGLGVPLTFVLDIAEMLHGDLQQVAEHAFGSVANKLLNSADGDDSPERMQAVARAFMIMRPHAQRTVTAMLNLALDAEARKLRQSLIAPATKTS